MEYIRAQKLIVAKESVRYIFKADPKMSEDEYEIKIFLRWDGAERVLTSFFSLESERDEVFEKIYKDLNA